MYYWLFKSSGIDGWNRGGKKVPVALAQPGFFRQHSAPLMDIKKLSPESLSDLHEMVTSTNSSDD